jgi:hypothetical protein
MEVGFMDIQRGPGGVPVSQCVDCWSFQTLHLLNVASCDAEEEAEVRELVTTPKMAI